MAKSKTQKKAVEPQAKKKLNLKKDSLKKLSDSEVAPAAGGGLGLELDCAPWTPSRFHAGDL